MNIESTPMQCTDNDARVAYLCRRLFGGLFEQALAKQIIKCPDYQTFISGHESTTESLYLLTAGAKLLLGDEYLVKYYHKIFRPDTGIVDNDICSCIGSKLFADQLIKIISNRSVNTNEAARFSLIKLGISFIICNYRIKNYSIVDLGSSMGLHLLWDKIKIIYKFSNKSDAFLQATHNSENSSSVICNIVGERPCFDIINSWIQPEKVILIDKDRLDRGRTQDTEWLFALTPINNRQRRERLFWALHEKVNGEHDFIYSNVLDSFGIVPLYLNKNEILIFTHSFLSVNWDTKKRNALDSEFKKMSFDYTFFEISIEFDNNYAGNLIVRRWINGSCTSLLSLFCDPQGSWVMV